MSDTKTLTPQGIPTTDFSSKVEEYSEILTTKTEQESEIEKTELSIRRLFAKYDVAIRFRDTTDLVGLDEKLTIYKPVTEEKKDGLVFACARSEGRAFSEIVANPPLMKRLEKKFGPDFKNFFRQVDDAFHMTGDENVNRKEVDQEKTDELLGNYQTLADKLLDQRIALKKTEQELANVDKYVDFCKKIVALAPAGKGGQQQQKPNQNQQ